MLALGRLLRRQPGFAGLLASTCALGLAFSFVMPFLSLWGTKKIEMSPLFFGGFMTLNALSAMVVGTVLGRWSDTRFTRRTMLLLGGTAGLFGYTGYAFVETAWILPLIGTTLIALASICFSQLFAHVRETFAEAGEAGLKLGFLTSVVRMSFSLAWTVGPAAGAWMMTVFGYRGVFLGAAALYALFLAGIARFVPHRAHPPRDRAAVTVPVWRVLVRGDIFMVVAAFACVFAAHAINMMNLPLLATQVLGAAPADLGYIFAVGPIVELPLMLWFGQMAAHGRQLGLIRFGAAVTVGYFV
ncbi:MAG TPA: MFS transporter, partial [Opitutaceae bacterium]